MPSFCCPDCGTVIKGKNCAHSLSRQMVRNIKHCQRHNGPEGWVLLTKVTSLGHITSSQTFSQTLKFSNIFRISTKHQLQNLKQTSAFQLNLKLKSWPNLASESWPRFNFVTSTKHQHSAVNFKILTKPWAQNLNKSLALWPKLSFQICNKLLSIRSSSSTVSDNTFAICWKFNSLYKLWTAYTINIANDRTGVR